MSLAEIGVDTETIDWSETAVDWRSEAACRGETRLFFPPKAERPQARARREAKALRLCAVCPVQAPCQQFARDNREYGFWAGESEEERHLAGFTVAAPIGIRARDAGRPSQMQRTSA
jgi:WhiB family redox-sensing transcriptional regulator